MNNQIAKIIKENKKIVNLTVEDNSVDIKVEDKDEWTTITYYK